MKKLFLVFSITVNSFGFSQTTIDYTNINYTLLERMVVEEINTYRASLGLQKLSASKVLRDSYSSVTASINAKQDKSFHTQLNMGDTVLASKLYKEYTTTNTGFSSICLFTYVKITQSGEIIGMVPQTYSTTYEDLAISMLHAWLNSPPHKKIIETKFINTSGRNGQISCCVKKSASDTFYFAVDFVTLDVVLKQL